MNAFNPLANKSAKSEKDRATSSRASSNAPRAGDPNPRWTHLALAAPHHVGVRCGEAEGGRAAAQSPSCAELSRAAQRDGSAAALDRNVAAAARPRFGPDVESVRVHTGDEARTRAAAMDARAYTVGAHLYFGAGEYRPETADGRALIRHELGHASQQAFGRTRSLVRPMLALNAPSSRLETRTIPASGFPEDSEAKLDAAIARRKAQPWPGTAGGNYLGNVTFAGLPNPTARVDGYTGDVIRRATKWALLDSIRSEDEIPWVDAELHIRVAVDEMFGRSYAMVEIRTDKARNADISFAGISQQRRGVIGTPDLLKSTMHDRYGVVFVQTDTPLVQLPGMTGPQIFKHKPWDSATELSLLEEGLAQLGADELGVINGINLRRLQGHAHGGAAGFFSAGDNSVNLFDAALPVSEDEWYEIGGTFHTGAVRTVLHELAHALADAVPTGATVNMEQLFRTAVLAEWGKRKPPANAFPPPAHIPLPTTYARTSWGEFFAETYSIYKVDPAFLQNAEYQYLYDFFNARYP